MNENMQGTQNNRLEVAKAAINSVIKTLAQQTNLGLLVFSGSHKSSDWLYPLGPVDRQKLERVMAPLKPDGGTPLGAYMLKAREALAKQRDHQLGYGTYRMLVLTDGVASDKDLVKKEAKRVISAGIYLDVIGVAMDNRHTLATRSSSYRSAMNQASLLKAMEKVFSEVNDEAGGKDTQETFELLKPLDHEVALVMLKAITSSTTTYEGTPPLAQQPAPMLPKSVPAPKVQPQQSTPLSSPKESSGFSWLPFLIFVGIAFFFWSKKKKS